MSGEPKAWKGKKMGAEEFLKGESRNVEYKSELPKKSERYMKSVIAFANTSGGKLIIGIEDGSNKVVGVDKDSVFQMGSPMRFRTAVSLRLFQTSHFRI